MEKRSPKVAIVTGGASGIGKAVSFKLFEEGHHVIVCDKNLNAVRTAMAKRSETGAEMVPRYLDVTSSRKV